MTDNFRTIPDFPYCQADDIGNIYRLYRNGSRRRLCQHLDRYGYHIIRLNRNGHRLHLKVHRLICSAFHGPCPANMMSIHFDGNKSNNSPDNLRWGTSQDNSNDKRRHGTICNKETHGRARFTQSDVDLMRSRYAKGETQQTIANYFETTQSRISEIITRKTWR